MITTFFGPHSFGGDAAYVDRLSRALLRRGHHVEVIYSLSAFEAVRNGHPLRTYQPPPGLVLHALQNSTGFAGVLWTHQTGRADGLRGQVEAILEKGDFDVVHFHNISLLGIEMLTVGSAMNRKPVRLLSAHEHWLTCPLSLLWKDGRAPCEQPSCTSCTLRAGRPPQLWRSPDRLTRQLAELDALIVPSYHTEQVHRDRGISRSITRLPYFLPDELFDAAENAPSWPQQDGRPYFVAAGRLTDEKGFDELIPLMRHMPQADLVIAGTGPKEQALRSLASTLPNVRFTGLLSEADLWSLYKGACAIVTPSRFYETFGYVVLEAFACGTPAIVRNRGALPELISQSNAGAVFDTADELLDLMGQYLNPLIRREKSDVARRASRNLWGEERHMTSYLKLVGSFATTDPAEPLLSEQDDTAPRIPAGKSHQQQSASRRSQR